LVGGNANNGDNAGLEYLNANNGVTIANVNYGSPLNNFQDKVARLYSKTPERRKTTPQGERHLQVMSIGRHSSRT
jgi:hypothetical protein